ncbi:transglutaminaseTgpA domain-containing protein [Solibacillus sp. CAU 1738]|uniref:transglutaminase TgpA family protein n=1 Tax=Solibacillus sp. CAU 1738 TaxID=3140363 RepID=UPI0032603ABB
MKKNGLYYIEYSIYYIILLLILREWLYPIMELTGTGYFEYFLGFVVMSLIISLLQINIIISWILKISYINIFIVNVYSDYPMISMEGARFLLTELSWNITQIVNGNFTAVSDPFRTMLFFVLIWMLIYLIHHWITVRMTIYYFLVLTIFFIATLDTFSDYDGSAAIVKVMLLGLIMTALLFMKRLIISTGVELEWHRYILYAMPIILLIGLSGIGAVLLPKAAPQWPDPVPYIKNIAGQGGSSAVKKVGYGNNDEQLGGSFSADDTVVFRVHAPKKQYWRVETKDYYTSKGWTSSEGDFGVLDLSVNTPIPLTIPLGEKPATAKIFPLVNQTFVLQAYGLERVMFDQINGATRFNEQSEKLLTLVDGSPVVLEHYELIYREPSYSFTALKAVDVAKTKVDARFLQLPDTLPERVGELAEQVTAIASTSYDKARAIERYFRQNGYVYETKNVGIPTAEQDYVDQFLFETKMGYCDNFSTSMVVMLRSVGIPARWVKGFAGGKQISRDDDGLLVYEIQNNDAHSWVEAYIDGVGWMQFEPTIGFSNQVSIEYDAQRAEQQNDVPLEEQQKLEEQQREEQKAAKANAKSVSMFNIPELLKKYKNWLIAIVVIACFLVLIMFRSRRKWLPKIYVQLNRRKKQDAHIFELSYAQLLKQLERYGLKRSKNQTLQSFARAVDAHFDTDHMSKLTEAYERSIYAEKAEELDFDKLKESWEYLINRTTS